ncbi:e20 [Murid betaherpesvirus 8]|nr:e20 [Murid betaherpesvirus 8]AFX83342.1 e20 [Murid betaherpesvirus 8]
MLVSLVLGLWTLRCVSGISTSYDYTVPWSGESFSAEKNSSTPQNQVLGTYTNTTGMATAITGVDGSLILLCECDVKAETYDNLTTYPDVGITWMIFFNNKSYVSERLLWVDGVYNVSINNFTWYSRIKEGWGDFHTGVKRTENVTTKYLTILKTNTTVSKEYLGGSQTVSCEFVARPRNRTFYDDMQATFSVTTHSNGSIEVKDYIFWVMIPRANYKRSSWRRPDVDKNIVAYVETLVVITGSLLLFAVVWRIASIFWNEWRQRRWRRRLQEFDDEDVGLLGGFPIGFRLLLDAQADRGADRHGRRGVVGGVAGMVPAFMAAGVAVAALMCIPGCYSLSPKEMWSGRSSSGVDSFIDDAESCPAAERRIHHLNLARKALKNGSKMESVLEFDCKGLGENCDVVCHFYGSGQFMDAGLNWAASVSPTGELTKRRRWYDHDCDIQRVCDVGIYPNPETGEKEVMNVCGYSGTCRWKFGNRANDMAGPYRCSIYYSPVVMDIPESGSVVGSVTVDLGNPRELTLLATVAQSNVYGCFRKGDLPQVESLLVFPIEHYIEGYFNWTVDGPIGDDGMPASIAAGAIKFNRTHIFYDVGIEGKERSYVKQMVDTVTGESGGTLTFYFIAKKPGNYHGLLVLDSIRRFSCVVTVPDDPCATARAERGGSFHSVAAAALTTSYVNVSQNDPATNSSSQTTKRSDAWDYIYIYGICVLGVSSIFITVIIVATICIMKRVKPVDGIEIASIGGHSADTTMEYFEEEEDSTDVDDRRLVV